VIAAACTIETIIEDPLLSVLKEDSNITKPAGQIRRPGLDHDSPSPRFKLFMVDLIPHPEISVFFNVRFYIRKVLRLSLRKKFSQSFFSWGEVYPVYPSFCKRNLVKLPSPAYPARGGTGHPPPNPCWEPH
jgi:hypothetical protein